MWLCNCVPAAGAATDATSERDDDVDLISNSFDASGELRDVTDATPPLLTLNGYSLAQPRPAGAVSAPPPPDEGATLRLLGVSSSPRLERRGGAAAEARLKLASRSRNVFSPRRARALSSDDPGLQQGLDTQKDRSSLSARCPQLTTRGLSPRQLLSHVRKMRRELDNTVLNAPYMDMDSFPHHQPPLAHS